MGPHYPSTSLSASSPLCGSFQTLVPLKRLTLLIVATWEETSCKSPHAAFQQLFSSWLRKSNCPNSVGLRASWTRCTARQDGRPGSEDAVMVKAFRPPIHTFELRRSSFSSVESPSECHVCSRPTLSGTEYPISFDSLLPVLTTVKSPNFRCPIQRRNCESRVVHLVFVPEIFKWRSWGMYIKQRVFSYGPQALIMHSFFLAFAALLAISKPHPASGAAVSTSSQSKLKEFSLDIVNADLAPDGFLRSKL